MTDFKPGDRVRYTNARSIRLGESSRFAEFVGELGTVTKGDESGDGHVNVTWDNINGWIGYPFVENLELVNPPVHNGKFTTVNELLGITSLVNVFNDTLQEGRFNSEVSVGNLALYDSNGDVLGYVAYNPDVSAWVFYDPTFKDV